MGRSEYNSFFKLGTTGVDLFFIISGFVIFMSLQKVKTGTDFIINRVSRLYPTYWASVTFTFTAIVLYCLHFGIQGIDQKVIPYLGNLTMFQFYLQIEDLDGPYWTLIIEMLFYLSMLILFVKKWLHHLKAIGIVLSVTAVVCTNFFFENDTVEWVFKFFPLLQFIPLFFVGTIFYSLYTKKENLPLNYTIIAFCFLCQLLLFSHTGLSNKFINKFEYAITLFTYFTLFILLVHGKLKFIVNKTTLFLGKISYCLYLIHQFLSLKIILPLFFGEYGFNFWVVVFFIDLPVVIAVATVITYKIEIPGSQLMKNKLRAWVARN